MCSAKPTDVLEEFGEMSECLADVLLPSAGLLVSQTLETGKTLGKSRKEALDAAEPVVSAAVVSQTQKTELFG